MAGFNELKKDLKTYNIPACTAPKPYPSARGYNITTDPSRFDDSDYRSFVWKDEPSTQLRAASVAATVEYGDPYRVGNVEGFTVYGKGTGDWTVQISPDPVSDVWTDLVTKTGSTYTTTSEHHNFVRVNVAQGSNLEIWLFRKYATY